MKGSAIVQGLKSWASALHPQLPLSRKESLRLLTALKTSFRRQLDEAHPPHGSSDGSPQSGKTGDATIAPDRSQGPHSSSAAFADTHMASVLTNPLLVQGKGVTNPDEITVRRALQQNPAKDPMELFDEYRERGHATVPIAAACLEYFKKYVDALPEEPRKSAVEKTTAGKRTLRWVWHSGIYRSEDFVTDLRLADLMVPFILKEGSEEYLWKWLALDVAGNNAKVPRKDLSPGKAKMYPYRWKALIIRNIVVTQIQGSESFDQALKTLFRAVELNDFSSIPMSTVKVAMMRGLRRDSARRRMTNGDLYDRLIDLQGSEMFNNEAKITLDYTTAWLYLEHPTKPSSLPALTLFKQVLDPEFDKNGQSVEIQSIRWKLADPNMVKFTSSLLDFLARTITQLEKTGHSDDAAWLVRMGHRTFEHRSEDFDERLRIHRLRAGQGKQIKQTAAAAAGSNVEKTHDFSTAPYFAV